MKDVCKCCGTSFSAIKESGFVHCEHCYHSIESLESLTRQLFGGKVHKGRGAR